MHFYGVFFIFSDAQFLIYWSYNLLHMSFTIFTWSQKYSRRDALPSTLYYYIQNGNKIIPYLIIA